MDQLNRTLVFAQEDGGAGAAGGLFLIIWLAMIVLVIAGFWKTFAKAGKPGWGAIIPIYNVILLLDIAGRPIWWIILFFIPFVNFVVCIIVGIDVARNFGKGAGFGLGLAIFSFIFYPILGFGDAQYQPTPP